MISNRQYFGLPVVLLLLIASGCAGPSPTSGTPTDGEQADPTEGQAAPSGATEAPLAATLAPGNPGPGNASQTAGGSGEVSIVEYPVPAGSRPHDVAPAPDGSVWYTAQRAGALGRLEPSSGETEHIPLGAGSAPHGVIVGPDGAAWVTDGGLNAIVRVDPETLVVEQYPLTSESGYANLNTAAFDRSGDLWFTGQAGIYGRLDPSTGEVDVFDAPGGRGPYGITTTPDGVVYYASLAGSHIARIDPVTGAAVVLRPPTSGQGARRVWADSKGLIWFSEWDAGQLGMYDPSSGEWQEWRLPGPSPKPYAVYVDERDIVWLSDFGANGLVRFDPAAEAFEVFRLPSSPADVRQILGSPGEIWGAESGVDQLVVLRSGE